VAATCIRIAGAWGHGLEFKLIWVTVLVKILVDVLFVNLC